MEETMEYMHKVKGKYCGYHTQWSWKYTETYFLKQISPVI